jgi:uncharacterized lipoprotein YmbA
LAALFLFTALAGCSTPPDHYHTLRPAAAAPAAVARDARRTLAIGPVTVPAALDRNEWVVRRGDTGAMVYDHQLWTQDLSADIAQALADYLDRSPLPDGLWADAGPTGAGTGADLDAPPALRVRVQVLRFDSILQPAPATSDQLRWWLECLPSDPSLAPIDKGRYRLVRGAVREAVGPAVGPGEGQDAVDRLARAHSDAVRALADDVAAALRDSAAERARACAGGASAPR